MDTLHLAENQRLRDQVTELRGGSLTLRGVGRRVTWATHAGQSGVVSAARLHRRLFLRALPPATGTLHVAGQRSGRDLTFRLIAGVHHRSGA